MTCRRGLFVVYGKGQCMQPQYIRAMLIERADEGEAKRYRFRASTSGVARDGGVIPAGEWRLDNYRANPVVLAVHDYRTLPIGKAVSVIADEAGLLAEVEYDVGDPVALDVMRKLDNGYLHAVSVGFDPARIEYPADRGSPRVFREVDLLEISNVAVPSDPNALQMHSARSLLAELTSTTYQTELAALAARIAAIEQTLTRSDLDARRTADGLDLSQFPTIERLLA